MKKFGMSLIFALLLSSYVFASTLGDVNTDGSIDSADSSAIMLYSNNSVRNFLNDEQLKNADINKDNYVNSADASMIFLHVKDKIKNPLEKTPPANEDITDIVKIYVDSMSAKVGETVKIPIIVDSNNVGFSNFGVEVTYNPDYFTPTNYSKGEVLSNFKGLISYNNNYSANSVYLTCASKNNTKGNGVLFYIEGNVKKIGNMYVSLTANEFCGLNGVNNIFNHIITASGVEITIS